MQVSLKGVTLKFGLRPNQQRNKPLSPVVNLLLLAQKAPDVWGILANSSLTTCCGRG